MKLDKLCNKQDEYMTPRYAIKPLLKYLDGFKTIMLNYCQLIIK